MTTAAIYEDGVLRPLRPLELDEGVEVQVTIVTPAPGANAQQLDNEGYLRGVQALRRIAKLPIQGDPASFSGADHDEVLYKVP